MDAGQWSTMPDDRRLAETVEAIQSRGIKVLVVKDKAEALKTIKEIVPEGVEVFNGSSTTLNQIGFTDFLKSGTHGWNNLHEAILQEKDKDRQADLRRRSSSADYFFGSVNAISMTGELVACDASGSRVTAYPFAAKNLILVAGTQKIAASLDQAMRRVREYVFPLENERAEKAYGTGSTLGKWVIIEREIFPQRTTLILVKEPLGF